MPYYLNVNIDGITVASSLGDGYTINIKWSKAYPKIVSNKIAYAIYMSGGIAPDFPSDFFHVSPTFISVDGSTNVDIVDLIPGHMYHFAVRALEYDASFFDLTTLPLAYNGLVYYPQSLLAADITATSAIIPLMDVENFPPTGTVKIGVELVNYTSVDVVNNNLLLSNPALQRGFNGTLATIHNTDGYDGYSYWDPNVIFWPVQNEEQNTRVFQCWNRFDVEHFPFTMADGYRQKLTDILTTNLTYSDATNTGFPAYDYAGYHMTDPTLLLSGVCLGSYIGGYQFCADGYNGVGVQLRGISAQDANMQRQEVLLSTTGEPVNLVQRRWTGITCKCMLPYNEYPESRCNQCLGSGIVVGWSQFFDPRRSDGKIMVRFDPTVDDLIATDSGLESQMTPNCWTLPVPTVKDRDFIVRYDESTNEEFRYEILNVTRNKLFLNMTGVQKFAAQRIRKTDPIYQFRITPDTSLYPATITTSISSSLGIPPHSHTIVISEQITSVSQINQITGVSQGHSHIIENGIVLDGSRQGSPGIGHTHTILL